MVNDQNTLATFVKRDEDNKIIEEKNFLVPTNKNDGEKEIKRKILDFCWKNLPVGFKPLN